MGTKTLTTYYKARMIAGLPSTEKAERSPDCETVELARRFTVEGSETAIVRQEWRLGGDGQWHPTTYIIVEWTVAQ